MQIRRCRGRCRGAAEEVQRCRVTVAVVQRCRYKDGDAELLKRCRGGSR